MAVWLMKKNSVIELATNRTYIGLVACCKETEGEKRRWTSSKNLFTYDELNLHLQV